MFCGWKGPLSDGWMVIDNQCDDKNVISSQRRCSNHMFVRVFHENEYLYVCSCLLGSLAPNGSLFSACIFI